MDLTRKRTYDSTYLTKTEAAEIVGLHPKTIEREIQRGKLRAFKPAGQIRIRPSDLDAWVESTALDATLHGI
jgi:excisionase family DNA binding protein